MNIVSSPTLLASPTTSSCSSATQHRLLYRGALSLPDSHLLLDGLTFFATTSQSPEKALLENPLALALESMRGRPSLRFLGLVVLKDLYMDYSGNISVDIHPQALLSQVYFENVFCLKPQSERGVKVALGDTDGPETTQIVIYARRDGHAINLCVGRISTAPPPPSVPRLPRPDDPIPRVPPLHLGKHPRVRELKRAHTSVELGSKGGKRQKILDTDTTFKVPTILSRGSGIPQTKAKGKTKEKGDEAHEDVFGTLNAQTKGKRKQTEKSSLQIDPEIEQGNKLLVKQMTVQYLTLGLPAPPPGSPLIDACGACPPVSKTHPEYKDILGWIYRGVSYALRTKIKSTPLDPQVVDKLVRAHVQMYASAVPPINGLAMVEREDV